MATYSKENPPSHVEWFVNQFPGARIQSIGAVNGSWWNIEQDGVNLHVEQDFNTIKLRLGGHRAGRASSKVRSQTKVISVSRPTTGDVSTINESYREELEDFATSRDTLYDAFVETFDEESIRADNR